MTGLGRARELAENFDLGVVGRKDEQEEAGGPIKRALGGDVHLHTAETRTDWQPPWAKDLTQEQLAELGRKVQKYTRAVPFGPPPHAVPLLLDESKLPAACRQFIGRAALTTHPQLNELTRMFAGYGIRIGLHSHWIEATFPDACVTSWCLVFEGEFVFSLLAGNGFNVLGTVQQPEAADCALQEAFGFLAQVAEGRIFHEPTVNPTFNPASG